MAKQVLVNRESERILTPTELSNFYRHECRVVGTGQIMGVDLPGSIVFQGLDISGKRGLIWGCGAGQYTHWAAARGAEAVGVDIDPKTAYFAMQLANYSHSRGLARVFDAGGTLAEALEELEQEGITAQTNERLRFVVADASKVEGCPVEGLFDFQVAVNLGPYLHPKARIGLFTNMMLHAADPCMLRIMPSASPPRAVDDEAELVSALTIIPNYTLLKAEAEHADKSLSIKHAEPGHWVRIGAVPENPFDDLLACNAEAFLVKNRR